MDDKVITETEAVTGLALAAAGAVPVEVLEINGNHYAFTKDQHGGVKRDLLPDVDAHGNLRSAPERINQSVTLETQDSLVDYTRDFKRPGSRLFAVISSNRIIALLDYHEGRTTATRDMGADAAEADTLPDFLPTADFTDHSATLDLPFSEEWTTWGAIDGKLMDQLAFARFIQENAPDISTPDAADVLEVVRDLRGSRTVKFTGDMNLSGGDTSFEYEDRAQVGRKDNLAVPESFTLRIPVYFGGETTSITAALRHDVLDGKLMLGVKLLRRESIRQATFKGVVDDVATRSGLPVVYGNPGGRSSAAR